MVAGGDIRAGRAYVELGVDDRTAAGLNSAQGRIDEFRRTITNIGRMAVYARGAIGLLSTGLAAGRGDWEAVNESIRSMPYGLGQAADAIAQFYLRFSSGAQAAKAAVEGLTRYIKENQLRGIQIDRLAVAEGTLRMELDAADALASRVGSERELVQLQLNYEKTLKRIAEVEKQRIALGGGRGVATGMRTQAAFAYAEERDRIYAEGHRSRLEAERKAEQDRINNLISEGRDRVRQLQERTGIGDPALAAMVLRYRDWRERVEAGKAAEAPGGKLDFGAFVSYVEKGNLARDLARASMTAEGGFAAYGGASFSPAQSTFDKLLSESVESNKHLRLIAEKVDVPEFAP